MPNRQADVAKVKIGDICLHPRHTADAWGIFPGADSLALSASVS
jgi:hypothetical protein